MFALDLCFLLSFITSSIIITFYKNWNNVLLMLLLSVLVAECGRLFCTVSSEGRLCCTLCTAGWSPPLCSIIQIWHLFGTTDSCSECWTHWPSPRVLRFALTQHPALTKSADTLANMVNSIYSPMAEKLGYFVKCKYNQKTIICKSHKPWFYPPWTQ